MKLPWNRIGPSLRRESYIRQRMIWIGTWYLRSGIIPSFRLEKSSTCLFLIELRKEVSWKEGHDGGSSGAAAERRDWINNPGFPFSEFIDYWIRLLYYYHHPSRQSFPPFHLLRTLLNYKLESSSDGFWEDGKGCGNSLALSPAHRQSRKLGIPVLLSPVHQRWPTIDSNNLEQRLSFPLFNVSQFNQEETTEPV